MTKSTSLGASPPGGGLRPKIFGKSRNHQRYGKLVIAVRIHGESFLVIAVRIHGEFFLALGFAYLCSTHCSPVNAILPNSRTLDGYPPSVKTGQQLYMRIWPGTIKVSRSS